MSKEAMKLALEALEIEQGAHAYLQLGKADHIENAITALREALVEQPAQQDIPDLIAGALGVSRGTAYDMMREALAEQPAQRKPLTEEQINLLINGRGDEGDDDYVEPTGDDFGLTDADLVKLVRRVEAHYGITGEKK
jgi:hypothetical protein